jgi:predicted ATPase
VHQRTAVTLMQRFPETALEQPELLAHHLEQAGALSEAIDQLALAGTRATARSAHVESARLFERALELLAQTPPGVARDQREVSLQLGLAPPLITTRGYASEAAEHLLRRAHALAANVGDLSSRFAVARGLAIYHASRAEYGRARPFAEQCRALADQAGSPELFLGASAPLIHTSFFVGDLPATLEVCERVAALYDPARHGQLAYQLGEDPGVVCAVYRALALQLAGRGAEALAAQTVAERLAAAFDNPTSQAIVQIYTGWLHQIREEPAEALARAERALAITDRQALHFWGWFASLLRGWARGASRDPGAELGQMRRSLASWQGAGTRIGCSAFLLWIADLERRAGHLADAARSAAEAREHAEKSGERHVLSEILRLEGELAAALDPSDPVQAEQTLRASLAAAESQAAWFYALRSATSLARERAARGRPEEARSLLELHVSRFAAEPGFPELCAARELLALL